ncbi:hypothetical protein M3Y96_01037500 [Aphelenchoides besseyi]|nr:hypothetical protein M3Y96_01037500 [Aphelenchoides besseyi]
MKSGRLNVNPKLYNLTATIQVIEWSYPSSFHRLLHPGLVTRTTYILDENGNYIVHEPEVVLKFKERSECPIYSQLASNSHLNVIEKPVGSSVLFILESNAHFCFFTFPVDGTSMVAEKTVNMLNKDYQGDGSCFFEFAFFYCPTMNEDVWIQTFVSDNSLSKNTRKIKLRPQVASSIKVIGTQVWFGLSLSEMIGFDLYNFNSNLPIDLSPYNPRSLIPFQHLNRTHLKTQSFNMQGMFEMVKPNWYFDGIDYTKENQRTEVLFQFYAHSHDYKSRNSRNVFVERLNYVNGNICPVVTLQARRTVLLMIFVVVCLFVAYIALILYLLYILLSICSQKNVQRPVVVMTTKLVTEHKASQSDRPTFTEQHFSPHVIPPSIQSPKHIKKVPVNLTAVEHSGYVFPQQIDSE